MYKVPKTSTSLSEVEVLQTRWYLFSRQVPTLVSIA